MNEDPNPFHCNAPVRPPIKSQYSWLTSPSVAQATLSAWSYSTSPVNDSAVDLNAVVLPHVMPSRPNTPNALDVSWEGRIMGDPRSLGIREKNVSLPMFAIQFASKSYI